MPPRNVYGYVYETLLRGWPPDEHAYVGKCRTTIHRRVYGSSPSAHTSPQSIARDPWKANILPAPHGYRRLETIYRTADPVDDEARLRRAEADWMARLDTKYNIVRPVRAGADLSAPRLRDEHAYVGRPARPARAPQLRPRRRRLNPRPVLILALMLTFGWLTARVTMNMPWPQAPWIASPMVGVFLGWVTYWKIHRLIRKALR